jgi:Protein of unknown function (DUF3987)
MISQAHALRLPVVLRERPQWLLAGPNEKGELKVPVSVNLSGSLCAGSSTDPTTWLDFDYALECALERGYGLGYVLAADDPFTCVDFDLYTAQNRPNDPDKWSTPDDFELCQRIATTLASYTELSQSGIGAHTWLIGKVGKGLQRGPVALYSQERFIACTGNVLYDFPIADRSDILANMASQMATDGGPAVDLQEDDATEADEIVLARAFVADNSAKFRQLWEGEWESMGYPSQSEADLSLMSMLTFYSSSNEQCRRLFRQSGLGNREKALKNDRYLDFTLRLIRGRQAREAAAVERLKEQSAAFIEEERRKVYATAAAMQAAAVAAGHVPSYGETPPAGAIAGGPGLPPAPSGLDWPPGLVGAIARFVYHSAPRPVKEVAIVAALGWIAGVCGKAWVIPGSGLNCYIILVARSAVGKEAMHTGLSALVKRCTEGTPSAHQYVDFSDFASGPALSKACAAQSSFVNVAGEFGHKLKRMANDLGNDGPMRQLRTVMTNLYQKSGPASIVGGITYSTKDNNVASISGVAYSMIGETTPGTLYESLTASMMEDGFLSRFTIVEYTGERPPANTNPITIPSGELVTACCNIVQQATTLINNMQRQPVTRTGEAGMLMDTFDTECDWHINSTSDEAVRQMWNRAHLKMCRIAALLAVADNHTAPVVNDEHVHWALDLIRRDIGVMQRRIESGDVGTGDDSREKKVCHILQEYLTGPPLALSYKVPAQMQIDGVVPRKYLQVRTRQLAAFSTHRLGATAAMDQALRSLCDSGYLAEIDKVKAAESYTFQGRCFRIVQLP